MTPCDVDLIKTLASHPTSIGQSMSLAQFGCVTLTLLVHMWIRGNCPAHKNTHKRYAQQAAMGRYWQFSQREAAEAKAAAAAAAAAAAVAARRI